jgi:hypothetical protein
MAGPLGIPRDRGGIDRPTLIRGAVVVVGAIVIGLAFVGSYVGALHEPRFHDVHLGVVGSPRLAERLGAGSAFAATSVPSRQAAIKRIDERKDYGAIVAGPRGIDVLVASAAGRAVALGLRTNLPPALRAATGTKTPVHVADIRPAPTNDPNGLTPFYLALGIVVASFVGANTFSLFFGLKPAGRRIWWRFLGFGVTALALGLGEVGIVNAIGPLRGHYVALSLVGLLLGTTVGAVTVALQALLGVLGNGVALLLFVVLGNPASGGPYATALLPGFWRTVGPYLPAGAGTDLVRNISYFGGNAITRPLLVLFVWLAAALLLAAVATRAGRPNQHQKGRQAWRFPETPASPARDVTVS